MGKEKIVGIPQHLYLCNVPLHHQRDDMRFVQHLNRKPKYIFR